ncbi:MAG: sigma-70 family RNA polymerase sigma factor [Planctomycetota bacterium]
MSSEKRADAALRFVQAVLSGDREAELRFIERMRCVPRILAHKNGQLGRPLSEHELEDLTQEVLTALWKKLPTYNGAAALETWAYRFCYLELMRTLRGKQRLPKLVEDGIEGSSYEPETQGAEPADETERVLQALDGMESEEADLLRLKHFEGLTFDAIGERLSLSPNTVKTRYYRGLRKLKGLLAQTTRHGAPRRAE